MSGCSAAATSRAWCSSDSYVPESAASTPKVTWSDGPLAPPVAVACAADAAPGPAPGPALVPFTAASCGQPLCGEAGSNE